MPVGAEYCVVAGQAAFRYSLMRPWHRVDLMSRSWGVGAGNSVVVVDLGEHWSLVTGAMRYRGLIWTTELVPDRARRCFRPAHPDVRRWRAGSDMGVGALGASWVVGSECSPV